MAYYRTLESVNPRGTVSLIGLPLAARYAIEASAWLAAADPDRFHRISDMAARLSLPREFLAKVFRRLLRAELVLARRGPGGGYRLALEPRNIRLLDVIEAASAVTALGRSCLLFPRLCGAEPCAAHDSATEAERVLREALSRLTLADLRKDSRPFQRAAGPGGLMSVMKLIPALVISLFGVAACKDSGMEVYRTPKQADVPVATVASVDGHAMPQPSAAAASPSAAAPDRNTEAPALAWKAPSGWISKPAGGMRYATFAVPVKGGEADLSVVVLEGDAGGTLPNVNRWRGQLGLEPMDEAQLKKAAMVVKSGAGTSLVVHLVGPDGKSGLVGAILPKAKKTWFFKLTGSSDAINTAKPALLRFLESLR